MVYAGALKALTERSCGFESHPGHLVERRGAAHTSCVESLPFLIFIVVLGGVVVFRVAAYYRKQQRREDVHTLAIKHGWEYSADDPFGLLLHDFELFRNGDGRGVENVLWGEWKGIPFKECDYWYYTESSDKDGTRQKTYRRFSAAVVELDVDVPPVTVKPETFLTRLADHMGMQDINFESDEFNRRFQVSGLERKFAFDLIDARMMQWLLACDPRFALEIRKRHVLVYSSPLKPHELLSLIATACQFPSRVPRIVKAEYGERR